MRGAAERYDAEQEEQVAHFRALLEEDPAAAVCGLEDSAAGCRWLLGQWVAIRSIFSTCNALGKEGF